MIYDKFENAGIYFEENSLLYKAISYAKSFDRSTPDGRYEIEGDDMFSLVMTYDTCPADENRFEAHKKYIDVQVILSGEETIGFTLENNLASIKAYSEQNDVEFFKSPENSSVLVMEPGYFAVFYPHDVHRPNCNLRAEKNNRKVVVKVKNDV